MSNNLRFSVAIHILTLLAVNEGQSLTSEQIANSVNTNPVVIRRVLGRLRHGQIVESRPGTSGGWRLQHPPQAINLCDIYRSVSGENLLVTHSHTNPDCPVGGHLPPVLDNIFHGAQTSLEKTLAHTSIADILYDLNISPGPAQET
jgi:Rrf2 family protein